MSMFELVSLIQPVELKAGLLKDIIPFKEGNMKALSWKQPYAELMFHGKIETRWRNTKVRGWVLICSSKKGYEWYEVQFISGEHINNLYQKLKPILHKAACPKGFVNGMAVGIGRLVECLPMTPEMENKAFVSYDKTRFALIFDSVHRIKPFEWKGSQGWKNVAEEIYNKIEII